MEKLWNVLPIVIARGMLIAFVLIMMNEIRNINREIHDSIKYALIAFSGGMTSLVVLFGFLFF